MEDAQERAAAEDSHRKDGQQETPHQSADFLELAVIGGGRPVNLSRLFRRLVLLFRLDVAEPLDDLRHLLDRAEGGTVTAREHDRRDQRRPPQLGAKISRNRGRRSVPAAFFAAQVGDSGRKGRITIKGIAGIRPEIKVYRQEAWELAIGPKK